MEALTANYKNHLDQIIAAIQNSDLLASYFEEESEDIYKQMIESFEPHIHEMYQIVAEKSPLQLIALEKALLNPGLEGMFLPKILGYAVLRGEINSDYKYLRPQEHFKEILLTIIDSANFEYIKSRIGQTIQVGFALSSDIWLTNLLQDISNKKVKTFLNHQRMEKYRDVEPREELYNNYKRQFQGQNFNTVSFPEDVQQFRIYQQSLIDFLIFRAHRRFNNESIFPSIDKFVNNSAFYNEHGFLEVIMLIAMFYDVSDTTKKKISQLLDQFRKDDTQFVTHYFKNLLKLYRDDVEITPEADKRMSQIINKNVSDSVTEYYNLMNAVHTKGYVHPDTIVQVSQYYEAHKGLSIENECLRDSIYGYCESFLNNLDTDSYREYFEINKVYISYINTFQNQKFNQRIKDLSLDYIKRLLAVYTDRKGKDYQDIKKFVTATFLDLDFKTEKELKELFTAKRK
ncbi:MAG: hypothetical protein LC107_07295 [Chitinophagales bacterium]|nr:hypothetical protein [Chitinophagales bacterium]